MTSAAPTTINRLIGFHPSEIARAKRQFPRETAANRELRPPPSEAQSGEPGKPGRHHRPGRGLGNCGCSAAHELGDHDFAVPAADTTYDAAVLHGGVRAASSPATAKVIVGREAAVEKSLPPAPATVPTAAAAAAVDVIAALDGASDPAPSASTKSVVTGRSTLLARSAKAAFEVREAAPPAPLAAAACAAAGAAPHAAMDDRAEAVGAALACLAIVSLPPCRCRCAAPGAAAARDRDCQPDGVLGHETAASASAGVSGGIKPSARSAGAPDHDLELRVRIQMQRFDPLSPQSATGAASVASALRAIGDDLVVAGGHNRVVGDA